jgi:hypothetical protein
MNRYLRALLNLTPLPALGALGGLLLGCATRESDRADDAERARERAIGERDEARRTAAELRRDLRKAESDASDADGHALTLSAEVDRLRKIEADALADDDCNTFEREGALLVRDERDELQRRCSALTERAEAAERHVERALSDGAKAVTAWTRAGVERDAARAALADAAEQWRATHQVALDGLAGREPAEVAPAADGCAMCLGMAGMCGDYVYVDHFRTNLGKMMICTTCAYDGTIHGDNVRARVATRADSCEARRHSPDPLAIACETCGSFGGERCGGSHMATTDTQ